MADLKSTAGIASPNPFWLASAPPTDKATWPEHSRRAGAVVWKTLGSIHRSSTSAAGMAASATTALGWPVQHTN